MTSQVLARNIASITDLKKDPMGTVTAAEGAPVAVFNRNTPAFYCVPPALFAQLMELMEDAEDAADIEARRGEPSIRVNIDEL